MDWATRRRSWPTCRDTHSPSPPCSPPVVCAISQAASTRSGRRHCSPGRARGCERRGVLPSLRLSPSRGGATGGLLPRGGAALGREAAGSAWRHRVLSRGRCGVHRGGARALPRRAARGPGRGAARAVGREDRATGWRRDRTHRATSRGAPAKVARDVPALGYLALTESERAANPPRDEGATLEAQAGGFHVVLDPASGAIRSLTTGDGAERVRPAQWSGLNQLVYVQGGAHSALW